MCASQKRRSGVAARCCQAANCSKMQLRSPGCGAPARYLTRAQGWATITKRGVDVAPRILPYSLCACGAAGSALPWHGRGRRFDPDQVHQKFMPAVYILRSETTQKFYIGCTSRLTIRIAEHQRGQTASTRGRGPWALVYEEQFDTLAEARGRERQLKSWKSHRSIQELIESSNR